MAELARRFCVGYAFTPKKEGSLLTPSLVNRWKERGIDLVRIDTHKPLTEQGPFDCVMHKLYGEVWGKQLDEFSSQNPNVVIIYPMDAVERLRSRVSMLEVVRGLRIAHVNEILSIPKQVVVDDSEAFWDPSVLEGLEFPVIAKPLVADGSAGSHSMSLVFNREALSGLKPPIVLQEFVNHGGVVFKVYVVGKYMKCVRRRSLPDLSEENLRTTGGLLSFSQISNLSAQDQSDDFETKCLDIADMPPLSFVTDIANGLRQATRLSLFNFDVIRDTRVGNRYLVIDINYFPGYAKMPSYETVLTDFFWDILHENPRVEVKNCGSDGREILYCCKDEQNL